MKKNISLSVAALLASTLVSSNANASGYAVNLFSGWAAGMANAGHGVQDDPALSFVNPAAMILNKCHHAMGNIAGAFPNVKFKGTAANAGVPFSQTGTTKNAAKNVVIPSGGFTWSLSEDLKFTIAAVAPYGLKFDYGNNSVTRYHVIKADMMTVNLSPSFAYRINELISLGIGFQAQYTKVKFTRNTAFPVSQNITGFNSLNVDHWNHGWTAGMLLDFSKQWKFGIGYRSNLDANLEGHLRVNVPAFVLPVVIPGIGPVNVPVPAYSNSVKAKAKAYIPHVVTLSSSYDINSAWTLYGSAVWTGWAKTKSLIIKTNATLPVLNRPIGDTLIQNWKNTWFFSGGVNYKINDCWSVRTGLGYDESPTKNSTRIPAIPDANKWWLGLGGTYTRGKWSTTLTYGHEFFKKGRVEQGIVLPSGENSNRSSLNGHMKSHIDLVSLQLNYRF